VLAVRLANFAVMLRKAPGGGVLTFSQRLVFSKEGIRRRVRTSLPRMMDVVIEQFLMKVANRVFTDRALSQVEVVAHLLGYGMEFANNEAWMFLNISSLYWYIFRRWHYLRCAAGMDGLDQLVDETVFLEEAGQRISLV